MKRAATALSLVAVAAFAAFAGYWWGAGRPVQSHVAGPEPARPPALRKVLYYRNPMGLPDTSPVPKKDPMGMDYIPVHEGEEPASGTAVVKISVEKVQKLGVRTEAAAPRGLIRTVRAVSTVQADERRLHTVAPRFEGWIARLHVDTTGQAVTRGAALMDVYSPELIAAQQEYLIARQGVYAVAGGSAEVRAAMQRLVDSALQRLRNWDISEAELARLQHEGTATQTITLYSGASGVVLDKPSIQGKRFMPGEVLYQIADLSSVWVLADVFEQDLGMVRQGQTAAVRFDAYPDQVFNGRITFIYPTMTAETRTAKVRIELPNAQALLKPAMYAKVEIAASHTKGRVLAIPDSAVLDSGTRQVVLVELGAGRFEPRAVKTGARGDGYVEILDGVRAGEAVVVSANFLIDAESNLKAALAGFSQGAQSAGSVTHRGAARIEAVDLAGLTVTLAHAPIASLEWPAMTMEFRVKDPALLRTLKPGQSISFDFIDTGGGEYRVVSVQPAAGGHGAH